MIDWVQDFIQRFGIYKEIQSLKADKFHGSITINFSDGVAQSYNLSLHRRAERAQP